MPRIGPRSPRLPPRDARAPSRPARPSTTAPARPAGAPKPKVITGPHGSYPWLRAGDKLPVFPHLAGRDVLGVGDPKSAGWLGTVAKDGVTVLGAGGYGIVGYLGADGRTVYSDRGAREGRGDGVLGQVKP